MKVLEEKDSPVNGKIKVVKSLGLGTYIQVDGLTQSGGVIRGIWKTVLKKVKLKKKDVKTCLVLGLGGGSAAKLVKENWEGVKVTGVDIDPIMVSLGKKYLGLKDVEVEIIDVLRYCQKAAKEKKRFDLILVDTYLGYDYPAKLKEGSFLRLVRKMLEKEGLIIFNRLYFDRKRPLVMKFQKRLEKVFDKIDVVYPEANIMFVCYN